MFNVHFNLIDRNSIIVFQDKFYDFVKSLMNNLLPLLYCTIYLWVHVKYTNVKYGFFFNINTGWNIILNYREILIAFSPDYISYDNNLYCYYFREKSLWKVCDTVRFMDSFIVYNYCSFFIIRHTFYILSRIASILKKSIAILTASGQIFPANSISDNHVLVLDMHFSQQYLKYKYILSPIYNGIELYIRVHVCMYTLAISLVKYNCHYWLHFLCFVNFENFQRFIFLILLPLNICFIL